MKYLILAATLLFAGNAAAVGINDKGVGEALIYPLYLTGDNDTLITLTNETGQAKALRFRVMDYAVGVETLIFNAYLKPFDTLTLAIIGDGENLSTLISADSTCTVPEIPDGGQFVTNFLFANDAFANDTARTGFGYIEVIEIGEVTGSVAELIGANDCSALSDAWTQGGFWRQNSNQNMSPPTGGLSGTAWIIGVEFGDAYGINPVALTDFSDEVMNTLPGTETPSIISVSPASDSTYRAQVSTDEGVLELAYERPEDAVSAALMTTIATADFTVENSILGLAVLYATSPTMRYYVEDAYTELPTPRAPFSAAMGEDGAPNALLLDVVTREGQLPDTCDIVNLVEQPSALIGPALQNTAVQPSILTNRVGFSTISSANRIRPRVERGRIAMAFGAGAEDWMQCGDEMDLSARLLAPGIVVGGSRDGESVQLSGLPVIVNLLQKVTNGFVQSDDGLVKANYGVSHKPRTRTVIAPN